MISEAVTQFCHQCGLGEDGLDENNRLSLEIEGMGTVELLQKEQRLLIGLARPIEHEYLLDSQAILERSHYCYTHRWPLHTQLNGNHLGLSYILSEEEVTDRVIGDTLESLSELMESIFEDF